MLDQCFKQDVAYGKISRIIKNEKELEASKVILRQYYPLIKDLYKYFSTAGI